MTKIELLAELTKIHSKFSSERVSNESSQLCTMWSLKYPPDVLEATDQLEALCEMIDMDIEESYAVELYDMTIKEAVDSLYIYRVSNAV